MYSSADTIPTTSPTASFARITRSRRGVMMNVWFAVPWRYSFVASSAPSVKMKTVGSGVPIKSVAGLRALRSSMSARPVSSPAASPSMSSIVPRISHVVGTETSFSHSERRILIGRCRSRP